MPQSYQGYYGEECENMQRLLHTPAKDRKHNYQGDCDENRNFIQRIPRFPLPLLLC